MNQWWLNLQHICIIQPWWVNSLRPGDTYICVSKIIIIGSDYGLSPGQHQAIIKTNAGILLTGPLGTNFSDILIRIQTYSFKKMHFKIPSAKWHPLCLGLNELGLCQYHNGHQYWWRHDLHYRSYNHSFWLTHCGLNKNKMTFCRKHFQNHSLMRNILYSNSNFTEVCPWGPNWQ